MNIHTVDNKTFITVNYSSKSLGFSDNGLRKKVSASDTVTALLVMCNSQHAMFAVMLLPVSPWF